MKSLFIYFIAVVTISLCVYNARFDTSYTTTAIRVIGIIALVLFLTSKLGGNKN